jgi:acyl CoA:acetate/3-ketoacid CoA transferase
VWANAHTARQKHTENARYQVEKASKKTSQQPQTIRIPKITVEYASESEAI